MIIILGMTTAVRSCVWNPTQSEPIGFWDRAPQVGPALAGEYVLICPPSDQQTDRYMMPGQCPLGRAPLIKRVAATDGDTVTINGGEITINGQGTHMQALDRDTAGRALKPYPDGTYHVGFGQVWVLSDYSPLSYDSRYFGPLDQSAILAEVSPALTW